MKFVRLAASAAAIAITASFAGAADAKTLRFAEFGPNRGDRAVALQWFADELKKRSGGSLELEFHWGGALLATKAVLKGVSDGVADMGSIVGFLTPKELRAYNLADLPVENSDEWVGMRAVYELSTQNPALKKEFDKAGVHYVTNYTTGPIQLLCKKEIKSLADLKGLKVRGSGPYGKAMTDLGAAVQGMAQPKVFEALDSGLIECNQNYYYAIKAYKQYEVAPNVTELNWGQNMSFGIVMNKAAYDGLTAAEKKAVDETGAAFIDHFAKVMIESKAKDKAAMLAGIGGKSIKMVEFPGADRAKIVEAGKKYVDEWVAGVTKDGLDGKAILAAYEKNIAEFAKTKASKGYPWGK
ncbi:MAG: C4-dicarboxylate TRAP transporter substrate-binding protein [Pseudolabrys sp.]